jgi:hypothetical protein
MLVLARIFPSNAVAVPRVAELPTCQNMLGSAGPTNVTAELDAVVRVLPIWKMKVPVGLPFTSQSLGSSSARGQR